MQGGLVSCFRYRSLEYQCTTDAYELW